MRNRDHRFERTALALAGLLAWMGAVQATADERFRLPHVIPADVFVVQSTVYNPEQDFIRDNWNEVWREFEKSGIATDLLNLAKGAMDDQGRAEFERVCDRFGTLCTAVDWDSLGGGEFAFAERMNAAQVFGDNVAVGPPDIVLLFRQTSGDPAANFTALSGMLEALVDEINGMAGADLQIETSARGEMQLTVFDALKSVSQAPDLVFSIGQYKDVVMFSLGVGLRDEVADMLNGANAGKSIADSPRYKRAFQQLPPPEDTLVYFDMPNLQHQLEDIFAAIMDRVGGGTRADEVLNASSGPAVDTLIGESIQAYEDQDYAEALRLTREAYAVDSENSIVLYNLACFSALTGEEEAALGWLEKSVAAGFRSPGKIATDPDLKELRDEPRFKAALAAARGEEVEGSVQHTVGVIARRVFDTMSVIESGATIMYTEGRATHTHSATVLASDAKDKAIYPVMAGHEQIKDWARYLPVETTDFAVSAGFSLPALYTFIQDSFTEAGDGGKEAWQMWEGFQREHDFSMQRDILDWLDTASISTSFELDGQDAWAVLLKVRNEKVAREKLTMALEFVSEELADLASEVPPLAMLAMQVEPTMSDLDGFLDVRMAMLPEPMVCGVRDGWMMMASSEDAMLTVLATAAGDHANVTQNPFIAERALLPTRPVEAITFADHRGDAEEVGQAIGGIGAMAGMVTSMIPEPEAREMVAPVFNMISRLGPVIAKINFFEATGTVTEFDGKVYLVRSVTHYAPKAQ